MLKVSEEVMWRGEFEDVDLVHHGEALRFRFELDEDLVEDTTALNGAVVAACYWDYIANGAFVDNWNKAVEAAIRGEFEDVDLLVGPDGGLAFRFELETETDDGLVVDGAVVGGVYHDYINGLFEEDLEQVLRSEFDIPKEVISSLMELIRDGKLYGYDKGLECRGEFDTLLSRCKEIFGE